MTQNSGIRPTRVTAILTLAEHLPPPVKLVHRLPPYIEVWLAPEPHEFELDEIAFLAAKLPNLTVWIAPGEGIGFWGGRLWRRQPLNGVSTEMESLLVRLGCERAPEEALGFSPTPEPLPPRGLVRAVRAAGGVVHLSDGGAITVIGDELVEAVAARHPMSADFTYSAGVDLLL